MTSITSLLTSLQESLVKVTNISASLPDSNDMSFERTLSRSLAKKLDVESDKIIDLVSKSIRWIEGGKVKTIDPEMIREGVYSDVIESVEGLLEGADEGIEKHLGIGKTIKANNLAIGANLVNQSSSTSTSNNVKPPLPAHLLHAPNIARPQLLFPTRTILPRPPLASNPLEDSTDRILWKPVFTSKPHTRDPEVMWSRIEEIIPTPQSKWNEVTRSRYAHPYADELAHSTPPSSYFILPPTPAPTDSTSFERVPFRWVNDSIAFKAMLDDIRTIGVANDLSGIGKELAIDLEHHDYRSWGGMTCLIQLSTRTTDYVIDALDPTLRNILEELNEFLADPTWIKVFHGAASDIIWLQRDFGLYIVGLFDTYHATKVLSYSAHSLASLLERFTEFKPDKRYQLADWRIRPIPEEMLHYARSDTHHLLAIYDHLRIALHAYIPTELAAGDAPPTADQLLGEVFQRSIQTASSVYELPHYSFQTGLGEGGWRSLLRRNRVEQEYLTALAIPTLPIKTGWGPGEHKLEVLRGLHHWRERISRETDESGPYILPNAALMILVEKPPTTVVELYTTLGSLRGGVSATVKSRKEEVIAVIQLASSRVTVGSTIATKEGESQNREVVVGDREPIVSAATGLWDDAVSPSASIAPTVSSVRMATSSMFGSSAAAPSTSTSTLTPILTTASSIFTSSSSFLGAKKPIPVVSAKAEAIARIHASLIVGGGLANSIKARVIPASIVPIASTSQLPVVVPVIETTTVMSRDHSYVPLSGRIPAPTSSTTFSTASKTPIVKKHTDSEVVIVSAMPDKPKKQKRRRAQAEVAADGNEVVEGSTIPSGEGEKKEKRKSKKLKPTPPNSSSASAEPSTSASTLPFHDYATAVSILDAPSTTELNPIAGISKERKRKDKKAKLEKGFEVDVSEFRRTPRVNNMPKRGNLAQSFDQ